MTQTLMPTAHLRFVIRDDKRILQQGYYRPQGGPLIWRDIPVANEFPEVQ